MDAALRELNQFLTPEARLDLKVLALQSLSGLTSSEDGLKAIIKSADVLKSLGGLLQDSHETVAKDVAVCLINVSANEEGASELLKLQSPSIVELLLKRITDPEACNSDQCCMLFSNLTHTAENVDKVIDLMEASGVILDELIAVFTKKEHNKKGATLHYLGPVLANLSQSHRMRKYIVDKEKCVIQRLLPFTSYSESATRRRGIIATLKNCCFETEHHQWLLGDSVDILPSLLLPLAGNTEYDEEDNDKLPLELQYLPEDKQRESDAEIRRMLLEALIQLCAKRVNREFVRKKNAYVILRELHKWERDAEAKAACESLVDILIRTEDEIGADNLKEVEIPDDIREKLDARN